MPSLELVLSDDSPRPCRPLVDRGVVELEQHHYTSILAEIKIASCFHNSAEPLFELLSLIVTKQALHHFSSIFLCFSLPKHSNASQ
jgi:hypothetical protein